MDAERDGRSDIATVEAADWMALEQVPPFSMSAGGPSLHRTSWQQNTRDAAGAFFLAFPPPTCSFGNRFGREVPLPPGTVFWIKDPAKQ